MDTQPAQPAVPLASRPYAAAHRANPRRRYRTLSAASLALALGCVTAGGVAFGVPAVAASGARPAQSAPATSVDWWQPGVSPQQWNGYSDGTTSQALDTSDAPAAAEVGLVEISSTLSDGTAAGTGMVLSSDGTVVTNHHVVEGATSIQVTVVSTGQTYQARFVGSDSTKDVAVLQLVGASGLSTVNLAGSAAGVGDAVTAVGDANGDGGSLTAAPGTVTATDQSITVQGEDGTAHQLTGLIEVNADVIPGDSGGALLDSDGQVVGMNVAASSGTQDIRGYVIPISTVLTAVRAIESGDAGGSVQVGYSAYLGVGLYDDTSAATIAGALDGSAAADAGLQQGDTITSLDGTQISSASDLRAAIAAHHAGDSVRITWTTQDGQQQSATVTLGAAPVA